MPKRRYGSINHWGRAFFMIVSDSDRLNGELITLPVAKPSSVTVGQPPRLQELKS